MTEFEHGMLIAIEGIGRTLGQLVDAIEAQTRNNTAIAIDAIDIMRHAEGHLRRIDETSGEFVKLKSMALGTTL